MKFKSKQPEKRNMDSDPALEQMRERFESHANAIDTTPRPGFKHALQMRIQGAREQNRMNHSPLLSFFQSAGGRFAAVGTTALVVVLVAVMIFQPFTGTVPSVYAQDNFTLVAEDADSAGVEAQSSFLLESKDPISVSDVKPHLQASVDVAFDLEQVNDRQIRISFEQPLEESEVVQFALATEVLTDEGETRPRPYQWAFQVKTPFAVVNTLPGNEGTGVPLDAGIEVTFTHENVSTEAFEQALSIEPEVTGHVEKFRRTLVFVPDGLQENTVYHVTVDGGLGLEGSEETLGEPYQYKFETTSSQNRNLLSIYTRELNVSPSEKPVVEYGSYGLNVADPFRVTLYDLGEADAYRAALETSSQFRWRGYVTLDTIVDRESLQEVASFDAEYVEGQYGSSYAVFPESLEDGYYIAEYEIDGKKSWGFIQSSELTAYVAREADSAMVWVNSASTRAPVEGAVVATVAGSATTNTQGIAHAEMGTDEEIVEITSGDQVMLLSVTIPYWTASSTSDESQMRGAYWRYLYTDRTVYNADDSIEFWGFLEHRDTGAVPQELEVTLTRSSSQIGYDARQHAVPVVYDKVTVQPTTGGTYRGTLELPDVKPGHYQVSVSLDGVWLQNAWVSVREYEKPAYTLDVEVDKAAVFAGEEIRYFVRGSYFEGTPVTNLDVQVSVGRLYNEVVTLDETGIASGSFTYPYSESSFSYSHVRNVRITAKPDRPEEGEISGTSSVRVFGPSVYLRGDASIENGQGTVSIQTRKVVPTISYNVDEYAQEPMPNQLVRGTVTEVTYNRVETGTYYDFIRKKTVTRYSYNRNEQIVHEFEVTTGVDGRATYSFGAPNTDANYFVRLETEDQLGRPDDASVYAWQDRSYETYASTWLTFVNPDNTGVASEEFDDYEVGEQATLEVHQNSERFVPDDGGYFLFFQAQRGVQEATVSDSPVYEFQFEERDVPNIGVFGVYFNGSAYARVHAPGLWFGPSPTSGYLMKFNNESARLDINLRTDKDQYGPGEEVTLYVETVDQDGEPVETDVNVNVVDEAYYALFEDYVDPVSELYASVTDGILVTEVSAEIRNTEAMAEGGGCFLAGTQILLEDGSVKPIEEIVAGDRVLTRASERSGELVGATVKDTVVHHVDQYMIINGDIEVTPVHRMFVNYGWQMIGEAQVGDYLLDKDGKSVRIDSIEWVHAPVTVYNFEVEKQHTYIADGVYVHNDKGGSREEFVDTAYFDVVSTDADGTAAITFELPDNITSWRASVQAIDRETKMAGVEQVNIDASLPFFIQTIMRDSYLVGDQPTILARAAGDALNGNTNIQYTLEIDGIEEVQEQTAPATGSARFTLPTLEEGAYRVTLRGEPDIFLDGLGAEQLRDAVTHTVYIVPSRLTRPVIWESEVGSGEPLQGAEDGLTYVTFMDSGRGELYGDLYWLAYRWGDRADEAAVRQVAAELLNEEFSAGIGEVEVTKGAYQGNGGIRLLSYADTDLLLTARIALLQDTPFDEAAMTEYLRTQLYFERQTGRELSAEEAAWSFAGLAALGEPVLAEVQRAIEDEELTVAEQLPLALALYYSGDLEGARSLYRELLEQTEAEIGYRWLEADDKETTGERTAWLAILAGGLGEEAREELYEYVVRQRHGDVLLVLEELIYLKETLKTLEPGAVEVAYTHLGSREAVVLEHGQTVTVPVDAEGLAALDPEARIGSVRVVTRYDEPISSPETDVNEKIGVSRAYKSSIDGGEKTTFSEGELVRVELQYHVDPSLPDDYYQLTDVLPSGLTPVSTSAAYFTFSNPTARYTPPCIWRPYQIENQTASFFVRPDIGRTVCPANTVIYYARVVTPGTYKAEPAFIRSMHDPTSVNYSQANAEITINETE